MIINLDPFDARRLETLNKTMRDNGAVFSVLADYVNNNEKFVTPDMLGQIVDEYEMEPSMAYSMLVATACGMDIHKDDTDKRIYNDYFLPTFRKLDIKDYATDPYLTTIKFPQTQQGGWELTMEGYAPCEAFVFDEPLVTSDFKEIPQIGFFDEAFRFPAILEGGREWMAVKPSEIITMLAPIENAHGNVLAYGLGLGYFAFMASGKRSVSHVTIIEKDPRVIDLFKSELLPQFPCADKIEVINADAFDFAENLDAGGNGYDHIFTDIWHDTGDGLAMYLKMKRLHSKLKNCGFDYWIERSLLSSLRYTVFQQLYKVATSPEEREPVEGELIIDSYAGFVKQISDKGLRDITVR